MEAAVKISACAVTAAVLAVVLKKNTPELAVLLVLAAGVWIVTMTVRGLSSVADLMGELARLSGVSEVLLEPVLKIVLLSILTRLTVEICRGAGEGGTAAFVETAGTVLALVIALPLVKAVVELMGSILS